MPEFDSTILFRDIPGFPKYKVSNTGEIWSCWRGSWKRLSPGVDQDGYLRIMLMPGRFRYYVHRIVLESFVGPRPTGMECRHFPDRNPANNNLSNLQWATHQTNIGDKETHGTMAKGSNNGWAKLTDNDIKEILSRRLTGQTFLAIATSKKVSITAIWAIVSGRTWNHLTKQQQPNSTQ